MRKTRLVDCNPKWGTFRDVTCYLTFDCPEDHAGHEECRHTIPFSPAIDGLPMPELEAGRAKWRRGDTIDFNMFSLYPSIKSTPIVHDDGTVYDGCAMHVNLINGEFQFAGDSHVMPGSKRWLDVV